MTEYRPALRPGQAIRIATEAPPAASSSFVVGLVLAVDDKSVQLSVLSEVVAGCRIYRWAGRLLRVPAPGLLPNDWPGRISVVDPGSAIPSLNEIGGDSPGD